MKQCALKNYILSSDVKIFCINFVMNVFFWLQETFTFGLLGNKTAVKINTRKKILKNLKCLAERNELWYC